MTARTNKQVLLALFSFLFLCFITINPKSALPSQEQKQDKQTAPPEKTAEEVYKNIQIFKGIPASRLMGAMNFFKNSLGVECTHCHVEDAFEKDDKPAKQTARKMYAMVRLASGQGAKQASCYMCHRGHVQPEPPQIPPDIKEKMDAMISEAQKDQRPMEQAYKNIQLFKGLPAGRLMLIMQMFTFSLGVDCTYCHVADAFEKDDKPEKQTARQMLRMVSNIAKEIYKGQTPINCYTCHKGQPKPVAFPPNPGKQ